MSHVVHARAAANGSDMAGIRYKSATKVYSGVTVSTQPFWTDRLQGSQQIQSKYMQFVYQRIPQ